jgi:glycosyltransferase involved in cell wall biosynthesis
MRVSFIIPAYNEARGIGACLRSIERDCGRFAGECEIIVCDNNSTDETREIVASFPQVRLVEEHEKGANRARQCALRAATGEFIASLDADTRLPDGWLTQAIRELEDVNTVAVSGPFIYYDISEPARWVVRAYYTIGYAIHRACEVLFGHGSMMQGGNVFTRRDALMHVGGYDTSIEFYGDDTALARALGKIGRVKWSFALPIYASGRRLLHEGLARSGFVYALNHFWIIFFERPHTKQYRDIRP